MFVQTGGVEFGGGESGTGGVEFSGGSLGLVEWSLVVGVWDWWSGV